MVGERKLGFRIFRVFRNHSLLSPGVFLPPGRHFPAPRPKSPGPPAYPAPIPARARAARLYSSSGASRPMTTRWACGEPAPCSDSGR